MDFSSDVSLYVARSWLIVARYDTEAASSYCMLRGGRVRCPINKPVFTNCLLKDNNWPLNVVSVDNSS